MHSERGCANLFADPEPKPRHRVNPPAPPRRWDHEITASLSPPLPHSPAPTLGHDPVGRGGAVPGAPRGPDRQLAPLRCKQENGRMKIARGQEAALSRLRATGSHPPPPAAEPPGVPVRFLHGADVCPRCGCAHPPCSSRHSPSRSTTSRSFSRASANRATCARSWEMSSVSMKGPSPPSMGL